MTRLFLHAEKLPLAVETLVRLEEEEKDPRVIFLSVFKSMKK